MFLKFKEPQALMFGVAIGSIKKIERFLGNLRLVVVLE